MHPTLFVLICATAAAAAAGLGALPLLARDRLPAGWLGYANALAAGLMLGVAYALVVSGLVRSPVAGAGGAVLGMVFVYLSHALAGTADLDLNQLEGTPPQYGYQVLLVDSLHGAHEGLAIGAAMAVDRAFGTLVALTIAFHNIPEGAVLSAIVGSRGVRPRAAAGLAVAVNANQILLAVVTFAVVSAVPGILPWALGFAFGALVFLVMAELLPESYREAGPTGIALVTVVAMGIVVLLRGAGR